MSNILKPLTQKEIENLGAVIGKEIVLNYFHVILEENDDHSRYNVDERLQLRTVLGYDGGAGLVLTHLVGYEHGREAVRPILRKNQEAGEIDTSYLETIRKNRDVIWDRTLDPKPEATVDLEDVSRELLRGIALNTNDKTLLDAVRQSIEPGRDYNVQQVMRTLEAKLYHIAPQ